jgi:hypothetical protein
MYTANIWFENRFLKLSWVHLPPPPPTAAAAAVCEKEDGSCEEAFPHPPPTAPIYKSRNLLLATS